MKNVFFLIFLFSFDTETNSWERIKSMNFARVSPAVTVSNGFIYIAGGVDEQYSPEQTANSVELYNPKTDEWTIEARPDERFDQCANRSTEVGEM